VGPEANGAAGDAAPGLKTGVGTGAKWTEGDPAFLPIPLACDLLPPLALLDPADFALAAADFDLV
jgi:hypothetical protein